MGLYYVTFFSYCVIVLTTIGRHAGVSFTLSTRMGWLLANAIHGDAVVGPRGANHFPPGFRKRPYSVVTERAGEPDTFCSRFFGQRGTSTPKYTLETGVIRLTSNSFIGQSATGKMVKSAHFATMHLQRSNVATCLLITSEHSPPHLVVDSKCGHSGSRSGPKIQVQS
jgi:hypothetical protein